MRWLPPVSKPPLIRRWSAQIPGQHAHCVTLDPDDEAAYVGDGWYVAYSSLSLHRLHLADGHKLASRRLRHQQARCVAFPDADRLLVATDSRLFELNRSSLEILRDWSRRVPRNSDHLLASAELLLMANWLAPSLHVFDLDGGQLQRRLVAGPQVRVAETSDGIVVGSGVRGWLGYFDPRTGRVTRRSEVRPFTSLASSRQADSIWLVVGRRPLLPNRGIEERAPTNELVLLEGGKHAGSVKLFGPCVDLTVSDDLDQVWCLTAERLDFERRPQRLEIVGARSGRHIASFEAPVGEQFRVVSPPRRLALTTMRHETGSDAVYVSTLSCYDVPQVANSRGS
jgi:hypothetical protein